MATRTLLPALALLTLLAGCGGDDQGQAKQAALAPAEAAVEEAAPAGAPTPAAAPTPGAPVPAVSPSEADAEGPLSGTETPIRESFSYSGGSRDPFTSLLDSTNLGPELPDLMLVAIYYDTRSPAASVVVLRGKLNGKRYSLRPGDRIGRIRVSAIRPRNVTFTIDDFGTERQETLSLRKQEDTQ